MNKKEKLKIIRKLSEKDLTKNVLIPLYESEGMGYKNVRYTHKCLEFGRDIICHKDDAHGNRIFTGIQVKKTKIKTSDVPKITHQIREAFGEDFTDSDGKKQALDRFVLPTSNEVLDEAKNSLWADLKTDKLDKLVTLVDGNRLVTLLDKHLPSAFWQEYDYFEKYFSAMKTDFETITDISAIGQREPIPLESIYVSLKLSEKIRDGEIPLKIEGKTFEDNLMKIGLERQAEREKIIDSERALRDYDKLVIVGVPGSGKTTLLRHFALKSCKDNLEKQERICVPIPITLREFSESRKGLREYIDEVFEKYQFPQAKGFVENDLKEGKCQLLLDGFDELANKERQEKVAAEILKFIEKYPKSRVIVTSRIAGYYDELKGFTKLELMEFDDKQIEKFIENWFGETDPDKAKSMLGPIKENEQIKALARNPLMIAIIAIIYEEDRELPQKRAALYKRCIEVLLSKWDKQKKLKNKYTPDQKEFILKKLAFYVHSHNKRVMTEKEVMGEMRKYLPQITLKREDAKPFLDEIGQRSYILRQISMDSYDFLHLSFQEYFTALELKERMEDGLSTIIKYLHEPWWEETILLYVGINNDAAALITRVKEEVPEDMFYSKLMLFGKCIRDADFTDPSLKEGIVNDLWSLYKNAEFSLLREKAIEVLALIKPDNIVGQLIKELDNGDSDVQWNATSALGQIGSEVAVEPLLKAITGKNSMVRGSAAFALGQIGSEVAVEPLLKALTDKDRAVRGSAAFALGWMGSEVAVEPLLKALTGKDRAVRGSAAFALGQIGSEVAVEPLLKALTDEDSVVQWNAASALGQIGSEVAVEPLLKAITGKNSWIQRNAASALGQIGSEVAVEPLLKALTDKDRAVRGSAASALGWMGSERAVEPLLNVLTTSKDGEVRGSAAFALGQIGSERAVEPLKTALKDKGESKRLEEAVSNIAFTSLEKISRKSKKRITIEPS